MSDFLISATLELKDKMTAGIKSAKTSITGLEQGMKGAQSASDSAVSSFSKTGSALGDMSAKADKAKQSLSGIKGSYNTAIHAKDEATGVVQKVKNELSGLVGKAYTAIVNVKANRSAGAVGKEAAESFGSKLTNNVGGVASGMMMNTGMQMAGAAGMGFGIYDAVKGYMDFEKEMSAVKAISGASEADFQKLTDKAIQMGADTKFSAKESAQALEYMGMAGWKADEMMEGLPGIMNLAAASGEDLAGVSDIVTDSMSAFKLQASDAGMFADVLAAAATNSNTNVGKLGYSFKYVAPLAGALGYSIQDVSIALGTMADSGIKAEQAGTSMRELLTRMAKPTKESADAMAELGLSFTDAAGNVIPLRDQLKNMRSAFAGKGMADQARLAAELAGQEGMSGLLAIVNQSQDKFDKLTDAIDNSQGAAEKMAKTRLDNLSGDLEYLSGDWDTFTMNLMKGNASTGLRSFVQEADALLSHFSDSVQENGLGIKSIASTAGQAVVDLKNKFLALDGIGSVLAGGALMGGLYKITQWSMKAVDGIKAMVGKSGGTSLSGAAQDITGAAKDMMVNAQTVIVNGNVSQGAASAAEEVAGGAVAGKAGAGANGASKIGRFSKFLGRAAIPLAVLGGAYEMYNAKEGEKASTAGNVVGGLAGGIAGAKAGAVAGGGIGAMFGGVGAAPGAAIGGVVGGVGGAIAGSSLGKSIGAALGDVDFAGKWDGIKAGASETWSWISDKASKSAQDIEVEWGSATQWLSEAFRPVKDTGIGVLNAVVGLGSVVWDQIKPYWDEASGWVGEKWQEISDEASTTWDGITQYATGACTWIQTEWSEAAGWFNSAVWQPTAETAEGAWNSITQMASDTWSWAQGIWSEAAGWFDSTVWQPISSAVDSVENSIENAFSSAWSTVQGIWAGAAGWFDSVVIGPIKNNIQWLSDKYDELKLKGAGITGLGGSGDSDDAPSSNWTGTTYFTPSYATGGITSFSAGSLAHGLAQVNEHGGELIDLPNGSRIYPVDTTERVIRHELNKGGGAWTSTGSNVNLSVPTSNPAPVSVTVTGNTFVVREEADIDKIAHQIAQMFQQVNNNYGGDMA